MRGEQFVMGGSLSVVTGAFPFHFPFSVSLTSPSGANYLSCVLSFFSLVHVSPSYDDLTQLLLSYWGTKHERVRVYLQQHNRERGGGEDGDGMMSIFSSRHILSLSLLCVYTRGSVPESVSTRDVECLSGRVGLSVDSRLLSLANGLRLNSLPRDERRG